MDRVKAASVIFIVAALVIAAMFAAALGLVIWLGPIGIAIWVVFFLAALLAWVLTLDR